MNISPKQARAFSVCERQPIEVAPGDSLMLTANRRGPELRATNGELVKVRALDGGAIRLEDGRTLPANYHEFTHGYSVTAHRSQGKTVDTVIISADAMKKELFYVAASRGRSEIAVVTSDREQLRESVGVFHTCKSRFCTSCGQRATETWQSELETVLPDVPYVGITLTLPMEFRTILAINRSVLHGIPAVGAHALQEWAKVKYGVRLIVIVVQQTFGGLLNFVPHLHIMVSAGGLR